jgi:hypothetical protein
MRVAFGGRLMVSWLQGLQCNVQSSAAHCTAAWHHTAQAVQRRPWQCSSLDPGCGQGSRKQGSTVQPGQPVCGPALLSSVLLSVLHGQPLCCGSDWQPVPRMQREPSASLSHGSTVDYAAQPTMHITAERCNTEQCNTECFNAEQCYTDLLTLWAHAPS